MIVSAAAFGIAEAAVGWAPTYGTAVALLFVTGLTTTHFAQAANHRIQLGSDPGYRGRVLGLYTLILQGSTPLGALLMGRVAEHSGARATFVVGGLCSLAAALVAAAAGRRGAEAPSRLAEPEAHPAHRDDETGSTDLRPQGADVGVERAP
ncbi:MFS transporter [Streptomyces diastatochromogenes]|nr:MFS transporter [Streptomyces diastatochromogenes]